MNEFNFSKELNERAKKFFQRDDCDGEHGAPACSDKNCWQKTPWRLRWQDFKGWLYKLWKGVQPGYVQDCGHHSSFLFEDSRPEINLLLKCALCELRELEWARKVIRAAAEHNGIGDVELHFGHDGDRTCLLRDIDAREVSRYSCDNMYRSVTVALYQWRVRRGSGKTR